MDDTFSAYADLCDLDLLKSAYADVAERFPAICRSQAVLPCAKNDRFIEELARDLERLTYQPVPSTAGETPPADSATIRDRVVQSAMKMVCESRSGPERSESLQADEAIRCIAEGAEHGLTRVFVARMEAEPIGLGSWKQDEKSQQKSVDPWFSLMQRMLVAYPGLWGESALAPYLLDCVLHDIDCLLEQAKVMGKRDAHAPIKCARFWNYLIVQVNQAPEYDWVIPGVQHRLRAELAKISWNLDPAETQIVDLTRGDKFFFWGFQLRVKRGHGKQFQVSYERIKGKKESATISTTPSSEQGKNPVTVKRKKEPIPKEEPTDHGSMLRWPPFRVGGLSSIWPRLPAPNWQAIDFVFKGCIRWLRQHWISTLTAGGLIVLVFLVSAYIRSTNLAKPGTFHRDFRRDAAGSPLLPLGPVKVQFQARDERGILITLPNTRAETKPVGVKTKFGIRGNFEITASYELVRLERPDSGWGAGVFLSLATGSPAADLVRIGRALDPTDKAVIKWDRGDHNGPDDPRLVAGQVPSKASVGRLRLVRTGSTLSYFVADGQKADFVIVHEEDFGTEDIESIHFAATTDNRPVAVALHLVDFDVKAESLVMAEATSSATWNPYLVSIVLVGLAIIGLLLISWGAGPFMSHKRNRFKSVRKE